MSSSHPEKKRGAPQELKITPRDFCAQALQEIKAYINLDASDEVRQEFAEAAIEYIGKVKKVNLNAPDAIEQIQTLLNEFHEEINDWIKIAKAVTAPKSNRPDRFVKLDPQLETGITDLLDEQSKSAFATTSTFAADIVARKGRQQIMQPLLAGIQLSRVEGSLAESKIQGFLEPAYEYKDRQTALNILNDLKKQGVRFYEAIFKRYQHLYRFGLRTVNEDILILLSDNTKAIDTWVKENHDRLLLPLDHDMGFTAVHYLAYMDKVDILKKLKKEIPYIFKVENFSGDPPMVMAIIGDSVKMIKHFNRVVFFNNSRRLRFRQAFLGNAAMGDSIKLLKLCLNGEFKDPITKTPYIPTLNKILLEDALNRNAMQTANFINDLLTTDQKPKLGSELIPFAALGGREAINFCLGEFKTLDLKAPYDLPKYPDTYVVLNAVMSGKDFVLELCETFDLDLNVTDGLGRDITWYAARFNDLYSLNYFINLKSEKVSAAQMIELQNGALKDGICALLSCFGDHHAKLDESLTQRAVEKGKPSALLCCQLLQPDKLHEIDRSTASSCSATRDYFRLASHNTTLLFNKRYGKAWNAAWNNSKSENLADRLCDVLDAKIEHPSRLKSLFAKDWDSAEYKLYLEYASQLKRLLKSSKDKNPVELFFLMNYHAISFMNNYYNRTVSNSYDNRYNVVSVHDPLADCARFLIQKTQEHILELRAKHAPHVRETKKP